MAKQKKPKKPLTLYKKSLLIYTGVVVLLIFALMVHVLIALKNYEKYEGPIDLYENTLVSAYYIRESDGKQSQVSYRRIYNIMHKVTLK